MPKVSVVIPCFNQGQFIDEAVDSVLNQSLQDFEIIIVNDGSTDPITIEKLKNYSKPKCKVICTSNQGPSFARNIAINESLSEYILPLDADDKIGSFYLEEAVKVLDNDVKIGIVYCEAEFFGEKSGKWELPEFSLDKILVSNMIFCSALFRKADFSGTKGFNPNMIYGWEDWDFWLSLIEKGLGVYKIPEVHFFYRIRNANSRSKYLENDNKIQGYLLKTIYLNHIDFYFNKMGNPINLYSKWNEVQLSFDNVLTSKDYRIGKSVLRPFRSVRSIIRKLFKFSH